MIHAAIQRRDVRIGRELPDPPRRESRLRDAAPGKRTSVTSQQAAELQVLLEGVALPASKRELVAYARKQDETAAGSLDSIPDRDYRSLDEVGEALTSAQRRWAEPDVRLPGGESGDPRGRGSYPAPSPERGGIRPSAPPSNPPQKAIEEQSK